MAMFKKKKDENEKPIEQEISELQRKFRVLENYKRKYSEDAQGTIRKQRAEIEKLTRENRKMKVELDETHSATGTAAENRMAMETISKLGDQHQTLAQRMDDERELSRTLTEKVDSNQRQIFSLREDMGKVGGVNASSENVKAVQKQIRILENRLDHAMHKFNDSITANRALRVGTSPVGESSYGGAADGGEEPWFSEAVSTVSLDLEKADETLKAFTKDAAVFKMEEFAKAKPYGFTSNDAAMEELIGKLGYSKYLEMSTKQLMKTWDTLHPDPAKAKKEAEAKA